MEYNKFLRKNYIAIYNIYSEKEKETVNIRDDLGATLNSHDECNNGSR